MRLLNRASNASTDVDSCPNPVSTVQLTSRVKRGSSPSLYRHPADQTEVPGAFTTELVDLDGCGEERIQRQRRRRR